MYKQHPFGRYTEMNKTTKAKLIVFEGPDGVGKTTLVSSAAEFLRQSDVPFLSEPSNGNL
jgi:thymidylate kinase